MRRHSDLAGALVLTVMLALVGAACSKRSGSAPEPRPNQTGSVARPGASTAPAPQAGAGQPGSTSAPQGDRACPVTLANDSVPPGQSRSSGVSQYHGNGALWTALPPFGVWVARPYEVGKNGHIGVKLGWWRGVRGRLTISGRRLDGKAGPVTADVPDGYGPTGFQASGIDFPTEGCWEVTGRAGTAHLTFVMIVVKASRWLLTSR